jgi:hypothetical protein
MKERLPFPDKDSTNENNSTLIEHNSTTAKYVTQDERKIESHSNLRRRILKA